MNATKFFSSTHPLLQPTQFRLAHKRLILPVALLVLLFSDATRHVTVTTLSDSFWAVSCYVAATLAIYHYLSGFMSRTNRVTQLYRASRHYQVFFCRFAWRSARLWRSHCCHNAVHQWPSWLWSDCRRANLNHGRRRLFAARRQTRDWTRRYCVGHCSRNPFWHGGERIPW